MFVLSLPQGVAQGGGGLAKAGALSGIRTTNGQFPTKGY